MAARRKKKNRITVAGYGLAMYVKFPGEPDFVGHCGLELTLAVSVTQGCSPACVWLHKCIGSVSECYKVSQPDRNKGNIELPRQNGKPSGRPRQCKCGACPH